MDRLRELTEHYAKLVDDDHQQFVGIFEYEEMLHDIRQEILRLERSITFEPLSED